MKFLKENSYDILKLFINQIGVTIFSFFLYTAVGMIEDDALKLSINVSVSVVAMIFYFFLLYTVAWDWGAKDKIRIDAGRLECKKFKGALMALYANIINFILAAIASVTVGIYMISEWGWIINFHFAVNTIMRFLSSMYIGVLSGIFSGLNADSQVYLSSLLQSIGFLILPVLAIAATHIGYTMGLKEKKIFSSSKNNSNNKK